jgi:hypothetical protein
MAEPERPDFEEPIPELLPDVAGGHPEQLEPRPAFVPPVPERLTPEMHQPGYSFQAPAPSADPIWEAAKDFAVLGCVVASIFVCTGVALGVAHALPAYRDVALTVLAADPKIIVGAQVASYPIVLVVMFVLVRIRTGEPFLTAISWKWPTGRAGAFLLLGVGVAFGIEVISHFLPIPKSLPIDKFFDTPATAYLMAFFGILLAPLLEEMFFRGLLYPLLRRLLGVLVAVLLTAALFAAIHGAQLGNAWAPILSIFIVGLALTIVRERTGSVAASFLTHAGYNTTLFVTLWFASDHFRHLEKVNL